MPGTFFGFNTALRGMQAQQRGIYTTSHNIANANTEGYTRQQVVLAATPAYPVPAMNRPGGQGWQIGTGVDSQETRRLRDEFLDTQIRRETGSLGQWQQIQDVLQQVEVVFNEPSDTGLSTLMSQFWAAWQELSKNAESSPVRTTVVETANALAEAFRHSAAQLETIDNDIVQNIELKVKEVNSLAQQIADLNGQIKNIVAAKDQPNDLMDQRDLLLDQLSKIVKINVKANSDGTITVTLEGAPSGAGTLNGVLVDGTTHNDMFVAKDVNSNSNQVYLGIVSSNTLLDSNNPFQLSSSFEGSNHTITYIYDSNGSTSLSYDNGNPETVEAGDQVEIKDTANNTIAKISLNTTLPSQNATLEFDILKVIDYKQNPDVNGEIKGLLIARDDVKDYLDKLNKLASKLATEINDKIKNGYGYGDAPQTFFEPSTINASNISVNKSLKDNPMLIGAAPLSSLIDSRIGTATSIKGLDPNTQYKITVSNNQLQLYKWDGSTWCQIGKAIDWQGSSSITVGDANNDYIVITTAQNQPSPGDYLLAWPPAGDGSNALAIAQLQQEVISGLDATFDDYYKNFTAKLGVDAHEATRMTTNQGVLVDQLNNRKDSISGVSLDEEMASMLQYQRAFEASARMITTLDSMLDKIINGMGVTR
ncbi:MAG: flagellar hook-associated protein 1 [Moorella sp. (in: firmicutes)]|uniref:Flagellar hook-associated protein 1 n=1 Tax=Moorella thermoacetica Y72 TaxID=1325331 RepID=A0A0S6UBW1_NEOTH|nr:flagellar hook-associated protein FlgK [Moorella thermoacetica]MDN5326568.1 flagellar hook-associated protein 1 [Moorella sp. (in: firmicutes)]GAF26458.1 flagellar hook-associated protein [Moorella thermoacetica Y72]